MQDIVVYMLYKIYKCSFSFVEQQQNILWSFLGCIQLYFSV